MSCSVRRFLPLAATPLLLVLSSVSVRAQATLPTGFSDESMVTGLDQPVGMAFLPDGRMLVTEQVTANVLLIRFGPPVVTTTILTVPNVITTGGEQGLLGVAVDPGWPARPYIYLHYDHSGSVIYISRFTVAGDLSFTGSGSLTIDPATRFDIVNDLPDQATNHNGGTLRFGPDGMLYSSLGDDGGGCPAQDLTVLIGKILRLKVSGLPAGAGTATRAQITPSDNPFVSNANANAKLVYCFGLRNPFRFAIDPQTGNLAIGDVGEVTQEEVDYVSTPGANLEWPIKEGFSLGPSSCGGVDMSRFVDPIYAYDHTNRMAVIGGPIYRRPVPGVHRFPAGYDGDIFFNEYYQGFMRRLHLSAGTWALAPAPGQPNSEDWATGMEHVSDYLVGSTGALWYCKQSDAAYGSATGEIRRIVSGSGGTSGPSISLVNASPGGDGQSCTIRWATDVASTSRVDYGLSPGTLDLNVVQATAVVSHNVALTGLTPTTTYYFRVTSSASGGSTTFPDPAAAPSSFVTPVPSASPHLLEPYPSPAIGSATLSFDLARAARVSLSLYDLRGERIRTLIDGESRPAGTQIEPWDGRDGDGRDVPAGIYFVRLEVEGVRQEQRFALFR